MKYCLSYNPRLDEIIEAINAGEDDLDDALEGYGVGDLEIALDMREDDGEAPPTSNELEALRGECDRNLERITVWEHKKDELITDYFLKTGTTPHWCEATHRYERSWHEQD